MLHPRWITAHELEDILPDDVLRKYLAENIHRTLATPPVRVVQPDSAGTVIVMAAGEADPGLSVVKVLYERSRNKTLDPPKPTLNGSVMIYDATGDVLAGVDGAAFTGTRTAAIAGVATQWLASSVAIQTIIGSGLEAYHHAKALATISGVKEIRLWARNRQAGELLAERLRALPACQHIEVRVMASIGEAVRDADVITTVTGSAQPLIMERQLAPTVLINAMGAYRPTTRELASDVVRGARLYADSVSACRVEAGDYLIPAAEGVIDWQQVRPLSEAAGDGTHRGRTVMKSVGTALFDVICAESLVHQLQRRHIRRDQ